MASMTAATTSTPTRLTLQCQGSGNRLRGRHRAGWHACVACGQQAGSICFAASGIRVPRPVTLPQSSRCGHARAPVGHHAADGCEEEGGHEADDDHTRDGQPTAAAKLLHQLQGGHVRLWGRGLRGGAWSRLSKRRTKAASRQPNGAVMQRISPSVASPLSGLSSSPRTSQEPMLSIISAHHRNRNCRLAASTR